MSDLYDNTASSVRSDIIEMVFGTKTTSVSEQEETLRLFINSKLRTNLANSKIVWKRGIARFPEINHFTGQVALYTNIDVLKMAADPRVSNVLGKFYKTSSDQLGLYSGPPAVIVKPMGAGTSHPIVYTFGDLTSEQVRYTAFWCLTSHAERDQSGGLEVLDNFETYFDLLSAVFDFKAHCKSNDLIHLESKWFSVDAANKFIEEYTALYNYYKRDLSCTLEREIPLKTAELYDRYQDMFPVPERFAPMYWKPIASQKGHLVVFSSRQAVRTASNRDQTARIYVQIPLQPRPENWDGSELRESYQTGKFGNWAKPGLRRYLRENSTEYNFRTNHETRMALVGSNKRLFGIE